MLLLAAGTGHATPVYLWSHTYGDSENQFAGACFADVFGNTVLCGSFYGSINITTPFTSFGRRDVIIAKFAPNGTPLWSDRIGFTSVDTGWSATSDVVGNVIVVGSTGPNPDERDAFVARYSPTGVQQWIKYYAATDSIAYAEVVATDGTKHIHIAGRFNGTINLGGSPLVGAATDDIFLAELDAGGTHIWSKRFTSGGNFNELGGIVVDNAGQPVLFGSFGGSVNFGGSTLTAPAGGTALFLAKFDTNGAHLWSHKYGDTGDQFSESMAIDAAGRICITGELYGNANFGGGVLTPVAAPDIFLAAFNTAGTHLWSKRFGGADSEKGIGVAFASNNDVVLTADGRGPAPVDFGGGPLSAQVNFFDTFVARFFPSNGAHRWSAKFAGTGGSTTAFADEYGGQLILGGDFEGTIDLGGGGVPSGGEGDLFVARFGDNLTPVGPSVVRASLAQNSPNPFNPQTSISYSLASAMRAVIEIIDASGARVTSIDEGVQPAGAHATVWNGRDAQGHAAASGVYFYRLAGMPDVAAKKMILLK